MNLAAHNLCSGCAACYAACARKAISMQPDEEGFAYPHIDESLCVNCGLCARVCPSLNPKAPREPLYVYAAKAKDDALRMESSSGGIFSLLARQIISDGGIVYGAAIRGSDLSVCHCSAENEEELSWLRGSKYVQSDIGDTYGNVGFEFQLQGSVGLSSLGKAFAYSVHQNDAQQEPVAMRQVFGFGKKGKLFEVLVGIGEFGSEEADSP